MHNPTRLAIAAATFLVCLALECWWVLSSIPFERITSESIHWFLTVSMGLSFLPLALLPIAALAALAIAALLAFAPAYLIYASGPPEPGSPQARMQARLRELKRMTPERLQKK